MLRIILIMLVASSGCVRLGYDPAVDPGDGGTPRDHALDAARDHALEAARDHAPEAAPDQSQPDAPGWDQLAPDAGGTLKHSWSKTFGGVSTDFGYGVAVGPSGDLFVTGRFQGTTNFGGAALTSAGGSDLYIASFTSSGTHRWSKRFGTAGQERGFDVAVDSNGNVTVIGNFAGTTNLGGSNLASAGSDDIFVASYTSSGAHRWSKRFGGSLLDQGRAIAADKSGNVYITGHFMGAVSFGGAALTSAGSNDIYIASYTAAGVHRWSKGFGSQGSDLGRCFAFDSQGNLMVTGAFALSVDFGGGKLTSAGNTDIFVASFTAASGAHRWSRRLGGVLEDKGRSITMDGSDNYTIAGRYADTVDFGGGKLTSAGDLDIFVASYTSSGAHRWSRRFGDTTYDYANAVVADSSGNIFITGEFSGKVDFGGGVLTSAGGADIFIASFSSSGAHLLSRRYGDTAADYGRDIATGLSSDVFVTGEFSGTVNFGGGSKTSSGNSDIFFLRLKK